MAQPSSPATTLSNMKAAYKELFPQMRVEQLAYRDRDLLRWLPKKGDFKGYAVDGSGGWMHIPVRYGMPQGKGAIFATAQSSGGTSGTGNGLVKSFKLDRKRYYGYVTIDEEAIEASKGTEGAFYGVKETEIEDIIVSVAEELEKHLWRGSDGHLGVISGTPSEGTYDGATRATITLSNPEDVANFAVGQIIGASDTIDAASTDRGGEEAVYALDLDAGTIIMTSAVVTDHSWADGDYLFNGAGNQTSGDGGAMVEGLSSWIPLTAEGSGTTFLGTARTDDIQRLQGFRQTYLGSIEETIKKLHSKMRVYSARPDTIWVNHENWHRLEQELGSRAVREDGSPATFGLPSLKYMSPSGPIRVYAGSFCPPDRGFLVRRDTFTLHHLKGVPHVATGDSLRARYLTDADAIEVRVRFWGNLACRAPMHNGTFNIS